MTMALMAMTIFLAVHAPRQPLLYYETPYFRHKVADGSLRRLESAPGALVLVFSSSSQKDNPVALNRQKSA